MVKLLALFVLAGSCAPLPPVEPLPPRRLFVTPTPTSTRRLALPPDPWAHGTPTPTPGEGGLRERELEGAIEPAPEEPTPELIVDTEQELSLETQIKEAKAPNIAAALRLIEQGRVSMNQQRYDQALAQLQRAVSVDPSNFYGYYYLAKAHQATSNYSQAIAFANRATALGSQADRKWIARAYTLQGEIFERVGRFPDARTAYQRAVNADPSNLTAYVGKNRLSPPTPTPAYYEDSWH